MAAGQARQHYERLIECLLLLVALSLLGALRSQAAIACPGLSKDRNPAVCTRQCQLSVCQSLSDLYRVTNNQSRPWRLSTGWAGTTTQTCEQLTARAGSSPSYCSWFGIQCCSPALAAMRQCSSVHAVHKIAVMVNAMNASVSDPAFISSLVQLHNCGLDELQLQGNDLTGSITNDYKQLAGLTVLDLSNNWLSGTVPDVLRSLNNLTVLGLGTNFLHGPIPTWLGELRFLRSLNLGANQGGNPDGSLGLTGSLPAALGQLPQLEVLNVETNALHGTLPPRFCPEGSRLQVLKLRGNQLHGPPTQLLRCHSLTQLDISNNNFGGELPDNEDWNWPQLAVLDASFNQLQGSIPQALYMQPVLGYINFAHNNFSGRLMRQITLLTHLTELSLHHNQLTGPIDENLWFLPQLRSLDLSENKLTGSLTESIGLTFSLAEVMLNGNSGLLGPIPPQIGLLSRFETLDIDDTSMSCSSSSSNSNDSASGDGGAVINSWPRCPESELIPCFLTFTNYAVPQRDGSNLACPLVVRRSTDDALLKCSGEQPTQLGSQAYLLREAAAGDVPIEQQRWQLDASYFQYQGCHCLTGYHEVWQRNNTLLSCELNQRNSNSMAIAIAVSLITGVLLLAAMALWVWLRMTLQLRPRWQREKELNEHRKKGMPCGGPATIVVTDIECYSELMRINAPLMTRALGLHNVVLRRAAAAHAGHVVEQEGDSWCIAFHGPMDAVAFCLQVQQALDKINWPGDLGVRDKRRSSLSGANEASGVYLTSPSLRDNSTAGGSIRSSHSQLHPISRTNGSFHMQHPQQQNHHQQPVGGVGRPQLQLRHSGSQPSLMTGLAEEGSEGPSSTVSSSVYRDSTSHASGVVPSAGMAAVPPSHSGYTPSGAERGSGVGREASFSDMQSSGSFTSIRSSDKGLAAGVLTTLQSFRNKLNRTSSTNSSNLADEQQLQGTGVRTSGSSFSRDGLQHMLSAHSTISGTVDDATVTDGGEGALSGKSGRQRSIMGGSSVAGHSTSKFWSVIGFHHHGGHASRHGGGVAGDAVVKGLRVRMGVATGVVPRNTTIARCALLELAKAVSDMANGGQILLEMGCFEGMKDNLTELGTVDHKGYNDHLLALATKAALRQHTNLLFKLVGCFKRCLGRPDAGDLYDSDALLLDMGVYNQPNLAPVIPVAAGMPLEAPLFLPAVLASASASAVPNAAAGPAAAVPSVSSIEVVAAASASADAAVTAAAESDAEDAGLAASAMAVFAGGSRGGAAGGGMEQYHLHLYAIHPHSLSVRAQYFGSHLTFKEGTRQVRKSYFEAPGTMVVGLNSSSADSSNKLPLPPVTMVFVKVDNGRAIMRRRPELGRVLQNTLGQLLLVVLGGMPAHDGLQDGYLCREVEGGLKYMVAFREPARALEWCLLMQEVMEAVPWPRELLEEAGDSLAASAADALAGGAGAGKLLPQGRPVLKMGLAEGQPHCVAPDHLGRADYHGPGVNLAARIMDAAAAGGQVVTSSELAERIFSTWRYEAELGLYDQPHCHEEDPALLGAPAAAIEASPFHLQDQTQRQRRQAAEDVAGILFSAGPEPHQHQEQQQQQEQLKGRLPSDSSSRVPSDSSNRKSSLTSWRSDAEAVGGSGKHSHVHFASDFTDLANRTFSGTVLNSDRPRSNRFQRYSQLGSQQQPASDKQQHEQQASACSAPHDLLQQQDVQQQQQQRRLVLPPAGLPTRGLSGSRRTSLGEANGVERSAPSASRSMPLVPVIEASAGGGSVTQGSAAGGSGAGGAGMGLGRASARQQLIHELMRPLQSENLLSRPGYPHRLMHVSGHHLGTFTFKGCGAFDMVTFTASASRVAAPTAVQADAEVSAVAPALPTDAKGSILIPRSGPVPGLENCPVVLPDLLPSLHKAWTKAAAAAAAAAADAQAKQMNNKRVLASKFSIGSNALGPLRTDSGTGLPADQAQPAHLNSVARSSSSFTGIGLKAGGTPLWPDASPGWVGEGQRGAAVGSCGGSKLPPQIPTFYRQSLDSSKARQQLRQQAVVELGSKT